MATKMAKSFVQYSKKMCTAVTVFWMVYRLVNFIVVLFRPETAMSLVNLSAGIDTIMITNMSTYLLNSSTEKTAIAFGKRKFLYQPKDDEDDGGDEKDEDTEEDGEVFDNG